MFAKKNRLTSAEVKQMFNIKTESVNTDSLYIKSLENNLDYSRFAVIVPKKIHKTSVKRHYVKRKLLVFLKKQKDNLKKRDYVITLRKPITDFSESNLELEFAKIKI
jgi:ribonuclease P protein component